MKNECNKTRPKENPYETWKSNDGSWTWQVLKKYQADDDKPYARWFCNVITPFVPNGELGDVYVSEIKELATKVNTVQDMEKTIYQLQTERKVIKAYIQGVKEGTLHESVVFACNRILEEINELEKN